jgi:diguanylate cyclase (GGDEF)-like protein/PAS domain S-box-containing protein
MSGEDDELSRLRLRVAELEARIARDEARFQAILANIPAVLYVKDTEGRYEYGSRYCFELLGIRAEDAIGRTSLEALPGELGERFAMSDRRVLAGDRVENESYAVPLPGGPRHFLGVRFPLPGPDGKPSGLCGFAVDVTKRIELERELQRLAITDPLTGVGNRRRFDQVLAAELARSARSGEPLSLVLCDVDHFKRFNDRYGHPAGDACLAAVAGAVGSVAQRPGDLVARYGGEELALVLSNTPIEGAMRVANRLREVVRALAIPHEGNDGRGVVTVSVGSASLVGAWTPADALRLADEALYDAKKQGRDRVVAVAAENPVRRSDGSDPKPGERTTTGEP